MAQAPQGALRNKIARAPVGVLLRGISIATALWNPFFMSEVISAAELDQVAFAEDVAIPKESMAADSHGFFPHSFGMLSRKGFLQTQAGKSVRLAGADDDFGALSPWMDGRHIGSLDFRRHCPEYFEADNSAIFSTKI
jgi:hypothetical protein